MRLTVELTPEEGAKLEASAQLEGLTLDAFVHRVLAQAAGRVARPESGLPNWPGRPLSDLRREDIYDDVR
jgi:hypothetical protein